MPWVPLKPDMEEVNAFLRNFRRKPRFFLDENVSPDLGAFLRSEGYNVTSVLEEGMNGAADDAVFQFARKERRILLTHNGRDFWNDRLFPIDHTAGIAVLGSVDPMAAIYAVFLMGQWGELWEGCKAEFSANGDLRIKSRNLDTGEVKTDRFRIVRNREPEQWIDE